MTMQIKIDPNLEAGLRKLASQQAWTVEEVILEAIRKETRASQIWSFFGVGNASIEDLSLRDFVFA